MAGENSFTIKGNLTADPDLKYTQSGLAVVNVTIASTPRKFDKANNEWVDGETLFMRGSIWREYAEHVAASLTKGTEVIATGRLVQRSYRDKDENDRTSIELEIEDIAPVLRWATAVVTRESGSKTQAQNRDRAVRQGVESTGASAGPAQGGDDEVPF